MLAISPTKKMLARVAAIALLGCPPWPMLGIPTSCSLRHPMGSRRIVNSIVIYLEFSSLPFQFYRLTDSLMGSI
jgi:hypothetical protein